MLGFLTCNTSFLYTSPYFHNNVIEYTSMNILIIEDESSIAKPIKKVLERNKYVVETANTGKEGLTLAKINSYNLIILDLNLPGIDGIEIAKILKKDKPALPIIMLTARNQMYDKLTGFQAGTDDYMTKPFSMDELIARINALLRRSSINNSVELKLADYKVNTKTNELISEEKIIVLSNKEMGVLEYLLRNKGTPVSAEELLEHVWDSNIDSFSSTVKTHIKTLRKKLGSPLNEKIETIKGKGYLIR